MRFARQASFLAVIAVLIVSLPAAADQRKGPIVTPASSETFAQWLEDLRLEAKSRGIREATLDLVLSGLKPIPRVIELDRRQPEFTLTLSQYMDRVASDARVRKGRRKLRENRRLLEIGRASGRERG